MNNAINAAASAVVNARRNAHANGAFPRYPVATVDAAVVIHPENEEIAAALVADDAETVARIVLARGLTTADDAPRYAARLLRFKAAALLDCAEPPRVG